MGLRHIFLVSFAALALAACAPKRDATFSRGAPESLLDVSSEVVNLGVKSASEVDELSQWINRDQPTRAELYCSEGAPLCNEARQVLDLYGVPTMMVPSNTNTITLIYERVLARDCNPRFVDNLNNYTNENHSAFGCSIAANIVQHVSNKQQFISPNVTDYRDAESAVNGYNAYQRAPKEQAEGAYSLENSTLSNARTQ